MRVLRYLIAGLIAVYVLVSAIPAAMTIAVQAGWVDPSGLGLGPEQLGLIVSTDAVQMLIWLGAIALYLLAAYAIVSRRPSAVWLYALAIGLDLVNWRMSTSGEYYNAAISGAGLAADYAVLAANLAFLLIVMLLARGWGRRVDSI